MRNCSQHPAVFAQLQGAVTSIPDTPDHRASPLFLTTHWSVVVSAQGKGSGNADAALEALCRAYWYPLYAYVRRLGRSAHDAQDLTQEFFARLLEKDYLRAADREKGRFRTFLLVALKRFLANEWDRARTQKRGGGSVAVPFDSTFAESRYATEPAASQPADREYEHRWAMTLLEQSMARLRVEYERAGRVAEFEQLKEYLTAERGTIPYAAIAATLKLGESGARGAVHRLRRRFRELFRTQIADTVSDPAAVEDEVRHVVAALSWE
jgi:RNA polymerase sigma factor (sigma-70 family)